MQLALSLSQIHVHFALPLTHFRFVCHTSYACFATTSPVHLCPVCVCVCLQVLPQVSPKKSCHISRVFPKCEKAHSHRRWQRRGWPRLVSRVEPGGGGEYCILNGFACASLPCSYFSVCFAFSFVRTFVFPFQCVHAICLLLLFVFLSSQELDFLSFAASKHSRFVRFLRGFGNYATIKRCRHRKV